MLVARKVTSSKATAKKTQRRAAKTAAKRPSAARSAGKAATSRTAKAAKSATKTAVTKRRPAARKKVVKSPLTTAELKKFRGMLLGKRSDLVGDMNGIEAETLRVNRQEGTGDLSSLPTHPADVGTDNYEQEFTLGLLESERVLLKEIDEALERIDNKTFGICQGTGKPIGKTRLLARPWAKYCIEYARLIEKGQVNPEEERNREESQAEDEDEDSEE